MFTTTPLGRTVTVVLIASALLLVACDGGAGLTSATARLTEQYDLAVSPGNHTAVVGDEVRYAAALVDADGRPLGAPSVSWSVADTAVAVIGSDGTLRAQRGGNTTVTVRQGRRSRSVPITVVDTTAGTPTAPSEPTEPTAPTGPTEPTAPSAPPPASSSEPMFVAGTNTSLWYDNVESTNSTADIYSRYATQSGENGVHLDATGGVNGSKAMRVDWRAKSGCTDDSHFIEGSIAPSQEVVVQYSVRYQPGFVFDWIGRGGPCSGNAKKLFFLWAGQGSRFDFISENHWLGVGSDLDHPLFAQNVGTTVTPEALADGQWHRITLRVRQSSTPTATDGFIHGWIDGVQRWSVNNIASNASGGWVLFKLPTTLNQGSPVDQSEWMDDFRIWRP